MTCSHGALTSTGALRELTHSRWGLPIVECDSITKVEIEQRNEEGAVSTEHIEKTLKNVIGAEILRTRLRSVERSLHARMQQQAVA